MSPELTLIYMEWQHWMIIWKYRIENKFADFLIEEAENRCTFIRFDFEIKMMNDMMRDK